MSNQPDRPDSSATAFIQGTGEMVERIRGFDWGYTPLGPPQAWSPALKTILPTLLANRLPMLLWWGEHYIQFYNDAYIPVPGEKHPDQALGRPLRECWSEIWDVLKPLVDTPFHGGPATWNDDILLEINRHGFVEESHFLIAYSPVPDETVPNGIGGVLATVSEITEKVVGERRVGVLRDLGAQVGEAKNAEQACQIAAQTLSKHTKDVPFVQIYLADRDGARARLAGTSGVAAGNAMGPLELDLSGSQESVWPIAEATRSEAIQVVERLGERFPSVPPGPWSDPPTLAVVVPIPSRKTHEVSALMIAGVSARLKFDEGYRVFFELVRTQIASALANARAYEEERERAEALAELDRAKTVFFSNVSHEFRTPLTLMLAPLEDTLARADGLHPEDRARLEVAHRNSLRLLRLVNTLLEFSRIEAGRIQASYESTDLAGFTAELASVFRAAIERAGLKLIVDCPPLTESIYVDRDMWEKIVFNLISNAFKFTFEGTIEVSLRLVEGAAELAVKDTGNGIPAEELPRLFERFHRVQGARGRTLEGSGIGLALVYELAKLHGGSVQAESEAGRGTTFTVSVPRGRSHLPADHIEAAKSTVSTGLHGEAYLQEALRWLPQEQNAEETSLPNGTSGSVPRDVEEPRLLSGSSGAVPRILLADDNADMREYVRRLLEGRHEVVVVADGVSALEEIRKAPFDLVLTDVMMPRLDGVGLLRAIRSDHATAALPVILLSARAGAESSVQGMEAGADDYLVKPFSARELLARVEAHLRLQSVRRDAARTVRESEARFRAFVTASSDVVYSMSPDWRVMRYLQGSGFLADTSIPFESWLAKYIPKDEQARLLAAIENAIRKRRVFELEHRVFRIDGTVGWAFSRAIPMQDAQGQIVEWFGAARDVTERKQAEEALRLRTDQYETLLGQAPIGVCVVDADFRIRDMNPTALPMFGDIPDLIGADFDAIIHRVWAQEYADEIVTLFRRTLETGKPYQMPERVEHRLDRRVTEYYEWRIDRIPLPDGRYGVVCYFRDISQQVLSRAKVEMALFNEKQAREEAESANRLKDEFLATVSHELRTPLNAILGWTELLQTAGLDDQESSRALKTIERNARVQGQLIEDLLDVSKIIMGKLRLNVTRVDVVAVTEAAMEGVRRAAENKEIRLQPVVDPEAGPVAGDPMRIQQILWNLLSNAIKFTPNGGRVVVQVKRVDTHVEMVVSDTGTGIREEFLPFLFDRFRQADGSPSRVHGGLGLGLAIVRHLAELHGGTVRAQSTGEGQGATFTVSLPLMARTAIVDERIRPVVGHALPSSVLAGLKVLLVDDERDSQEVVAEVLTQSSASVIRASSSAEALALLDQQPIDVILADIGMPGEDGYAFIRKVRQGEASGGGRWIPAGALTAYAGPEERHRALVGGYQMHIPKPVEAAELVAVVANLGDLSRRA